jgi:histidine phosphotransferase ChpT
MGHPPAEPTTAETAVAETAELVALICSRLCHDLAGSIGAVNNGVELLAEETDAAMREDAIGLIAQSAADAARRLGFFRMALGASGGLHETMSLAELGRVAQDYFHGGRLALALPQQDAAMPKALGKALLLGLSLAGSALPRGGNLTLLREGNAWAIRGEGPMLRWSEAMAGGISDRADWPREPVAAVARYIRLLAGSARFVPQATADDARLTLLFTPAP